MKALIPVNLRTEFQISAPGIWWGLLNIQMPTRMMIAL